MRRLLGVAVLVLVAAPCYADVHLSINPGVWVAYGSESDFGLGCGVAMPLRVLHPRLKLAFGVTYHWPSAAAERLDRTYRGQSATAIDKRASWQFHWDVLREIRFRRGSVRPYLGAGFAYRHSRTTTTYTTTYRDLRREISHDTNATVRMVGGVNLPTKSGAGFVQAAFQFDESPELFATLGIRF